MEHHLSILIVAVVGAGILAQWLSWRFAVPAIVLLSLAGLLLGPISGWAHPTKDFGPALRPLIGLAVAIILFEGGLTLRMQELKREGRQIMRLIVAGLPLNFALGFLASRFVGGLSVPVALLFGAIMTVTGPTVIIPLLRQARLARRPASLLKWEGIINDPLGAMLAVLVYEYFVFEGQHQWPTVVGKVVFSVVLAVGMAIVVRAVLRFSFFRGYVPEFLKAPALFASVLLCYAIANLVQEEAGLLAVTALGIAIGNTPLASMREIHRFKEYMTTLLVSAVFVLLTADLDLRIIAELDLRRWALLASMLFVVRPLAIFLATWRTELTVKERLFVGLIAPRGIVAGAVAGVFGGAFAATGIPDAKLLVPLTFAMIFVTVTLHGFGVRWLAMWFDLANADRPGVLIVGASPWSAALAKHLTEKKVKVLLADASRERLADPRMAGVSVYHGELLADPHDADVDLSDYGFMLAASENNAYNALACVNFGPVFGRDRVYLLTAETIDDDVEHLDVALRGHVVLGSELTHLDLLGQLEEGWRFKTTTFTEQYGLDDYLMDQPVGAVPIGLIKADGQVRFNVPGREMQPKPGDRLVTFAPDNGVAP